MNHKLAKQLKDAGFPQGETEVGACMDDNMNEVLSKETHSLIPTLEELIEACGDEFTCLTNNLDEWKVSANLDIPSNERILIFGKTPSEAVAKLWLALNT